MMLSEEAAGVAGQAARTGASGGRAAATGSAAGTGTGSRKTSTATGTAPYRTRGRA